MISSEKEGISQEIRFLTERFETEMAEFPRKKRGCHAG